MLRPSPKAGKAAFLTAVQQFGGDAPRPPANLAGRNCHIFRVLFADRDVSEHRRMSIWCPEEDPLFRDKSTTYKKVGPFCFP